jgi:glycosyltransferase involved in cell wall biosynthesis
MLGSNMDGSRSSDDGVQHADGRSPSILMVTARFAPDIGGTETHVAEVAARLEQRGLAVTVLTTDRTGDLPAREVVDGVPIRRIRAYPSSRDWYIAPALLRAVRRSRADIIHVQGIHTAVAPIAMTVARLSRRPYVVTFHTGGHRSALRRRLRNVQWGLLAPMLHGADALVAVSERERDQMADAAHLDRRRLAVIPNGAGFPGGIVPDVDVDPNLVLSVGRLERYKGHHRAVAALPELLRLRPGARLEILGDGPERERLAAQAVELGVADRVTIRSIPASERAEMARSMAAAGLVVLQSEYEAHPLAAMEALSLGRPLLVADAPGLHELWVSGQADMVPLDASPTLLARAIEDVLRQAGSSANELPGWDDCTDAVLEVYRGVLARRGAQR